ncbi:hypothetical protein Lser_V15G29686 [Lactuca serriola]
MGKGGKSDRLNVEEENMVAWLVSTNTLKIQPFKLLPLGPYDVRVRMKVVGICNSNVHYLKALRCAYFVVKEPMDIGYECAGGIKEILSNVNDLVPVDCVALEPEISCWRCTQCKEGQYNLCPDMKFFATPPVHGFLANQVVHPVDSCFKLWRGRKFIKSFNLPSMQSRRYRVQKFDHVHVDTMNGPPQDNVATIGDVPEPTYISDDPPLKFVIVAGVPSPVFDDEVSEEIILSLSSKSSDEKDELDQNDVVPPPSEKPLEGHQDSPTQ